MTLKYIFRTFAFLTIAYCAPAQADWHEAQSDHFVIYADDKEDDIRRFAESLERYHAAMSYVTGREVPKPSPSNRVTIFAVGGKGDMRRLSGSRNVAGFYSPRAGGSKAFIQDIRWKNGYPHFTTVILLHEYAHHFLMSSSRYAMPRWMNEGAAEFFASAGFNKDGGILVGRPALHRSGDLAVSKTMDIEDILAPKEGKTDAGFYGRSWLLYHYLTFEPAREGQLTEYWRQTASGKDSLTAGQLAFGDLRKLNTEMKSYVRRRRMLTYAIPPERISIGEVTLRKLPEGEAEMMDVRIRSQRGVDADTAAEVIVDARKIAEKYPEDPGVLTALAEAEFDAGNDDAAIAAADKAIALDPSRANAYVQKGYALFRKAKEAEEPDAAYDAAMAPFIQLNKLENDHPLPLIYHYRSFVNRGKTPNENARHALKRASQLAPFDHSLAMNVALMQAMEGKTKLAMQTLAPLAGNPHGGGLAKRAKQFSKALEDAPEGQAFSISFAKDVKEEQESEGSSDATDPDGSEGTADNPAEE